MTVSAGWLLAGMVLGLFAGIVLFAMFSVEREADVKGERPVLPGGAPLDEAASSRTTI